MIIIIEIILIIVIIPFLFFAFEFLIDKFKDRFYATEVKYVQMSPGVAIYSREIWRSDGWLIERTDISKEVYESKHKDEIRLKKLAKVLKNLS